MVTLDWLTGHRFRHLERREYDWAFSFDGQAYLTVACLWRLLERGRIKLTSEDEGQQFGRNAPVEPVEEINCCLATALVESVTLREGTMDLRLQFSNGYLLEVLPTSSGYEAWDAGDGARRFIAVKGGVHVCDP